MTPTDAVPVLQAALIVAGALGVLLWRLPGPCACEQCGFHVNERRMAALKREEKRLADIAMAHDTDHKGFGWKDGAPDRFHCDDEACARNPKGVE